MGFQNQPTLPSPSPFLLPWWEPVFLGTPTPLGKIPVRVPYSSGHTCCSEWSWPSCQQSVVTPNKGC